MRRGPGPSDSAWLLMASLGLLVLLALVLAFVYA
jgi:hypothetical protein